MPRRIQKSITLDYQILTTFERQFPNLNFSQWVEDQMGMFIKEKGTPQPQKPHIEFEPPEPTLKPDLLKIKDRDKAEARAREILSEFGQSEKKLEENLARIMQRWDERHPKKRPDPI